MHKRMVRRNPPWSNLPQELLTIISNYVHLTSGPISVLNFRSVCRSWRSSCPNNSSILSPLLPISFPTPPDSFHSSSPCCFLSITIIYAFHRPLGFSSFSPSPNTWILFVDEFVPGKLSVRKPFLSGSYPIPMNFPNNIDMLEYNVRELGRFHNLSYSSYCDVLYGHCKLSKPRFRYLPKFNKVVMFPNATAIITLGENGTLGMYRLDDGVIKGYETKHDGKAFLFDDIVEFKGRILGIDRTGTGYEINYHSSEMTPFVAPPPIDDIDGDGRRKRLVESLGHLYLVVRWKRPEYSIIKETKKAKFKVYELNEDGQKWIEITSIGDRFFSFGHTFSFSASAQELGTCTIKNCILFVKLSFPSYYRDVRFDGLRLPNCKVGDLDIGVYHLHNSNDIDVIESYPGYSNTLWPPPSWIWSIDRLKRVKIVETAMDEILNKIPHNFKIEVENAENSCDDDSLAVIGFVKVIRKLKKMAIKFEGEEIEESMDMLNQVIMRKRDTYLLHIEEEATQLELSMKSHIAPLLSKSDKQDVCSGYLASFFGTFHRWLLNYERRRG